MTDVVAFLRARLDEAEAPARAALELEQPDFTHRYEWVRHSQYRGISGSIYLPGAPSPARVLREVEAKRRILAEHVHFGPDEWNPRYCIRCGEIIHGDHCLTVRYLALPYSDHSEYDPAWSPDAG